MSHLREVVGTPQVPSLLTSSMVGRLPTAMAALAVLLLVRGEHGSYTLAGALAALFTIGTGIGQPGLARVVDRRGQPGVLLAAGAVSAVAFVLLAVAGVHHIGVAVPAALAAGLATPPLEPCLRALWPSVVGDGPRLSAALSLDVGLQEIIFVVGPLLATGGVAVFGHDGAVLACAVFGATGCLAFAGLRAPRAWVPHLVEGARGTPLRSPALVRVFLVALACAVPVGALPVLASAYAQRHGGSALTGWVLTANAAGALVAGVLGATRPRAFDRLGVTSAGLLLALGYLPLAAPVPVGAWLTLAVVSGFGLPPALTVIFGRVHTLCPPSLLTEANAWVLTAFSVGISVAALVAGVVTDALGPRTAVPVIVLGGSALTALVCLLAAPARARLLRRVG